MRSIFPQPCDHDFEYLLNCTIKPESTAVIGGKWLNENFTEPLENERYWKIYFRIIFVCKPCYTLVVTRNKNLGRAIDGTRTTTGSRRGSYWLGTFSKSSYKIQPPRETKTPLLSAVIRASARYTIKNDAFYTPAPNLPFISDTRTAPALTDSTCDPREDCRVLIGARICCKRRSTRRTKFFFLILSFHYPIIAEIFDQGDDDVKIL